MRIILWSRLNEHPLIVDGSNNLPDVLQEAEITVYTLEECEDAFGANDIDDNEHVCVGLSGTSGACNVRSILIVKFLLK